MTVGASRAGLTITRQPALAPSPQPQPAPTARSLPPKHVAQKGQNWTPIEGQIWTPIDTQRLDVFLPQRNLAVEYQGEQHYQAVSAFGGAEALARTIERDVLKKRLCKENAIDLVYVRYSDPLSVASLRSLPCRWHAHELPSSHRSSRTAA